MTSSDLPRSGSEHRDFAFYYPGPVWHSSDAIKNLLPFFDGVGLLVPSYLRDKPDTVDPALAQPLRERGLLLNVEPEVHMDQAATEQLAQAMVDIIASGALEHLSRDGEPFHELSMSRLGFMGDEGLANMLFEELKRLGVATDSQDGVSVPMHRHVRVLILVLLAQILRPKGAELGVELVPTTDRPDLIGALAQILDVPVAPSYGNVVFTDLQAVGADLSLVPLDEILDYRSQNAAKYRAYVNAVRQFVWQLSQMPEAERELAVDRREQELADLGQALRDANRRAWRKPAAVTLGAAGAVWTAISGDFVGGILAMGGAAVTMLEGRGEDIAGAYSFLFSIPRRSGYSH